jgi:outer membrane receptor protein involved in Fe transport
VWNPKINLTRLMGRHSIETGYEYQGIATEVQDVNPLYGRDTYSNQFTRPAGVASNNIYNLADFMLGLRSQYALSSVLVAHLRQDMHFLYVQDDFRMNDKLTLNLGLRYEYATPYWERDNILTNFNPATLTMVGAKDGSISDVRSSIPTATTSVRGSGSRGRLLEAAPRQSSAAATASGTCTTTAPVVATSSRHSWRQAGYPAGLADPKQFNPLTANITYLPPNSGRPRAELVFVGAA